MGWTNSIALQKRTHSETAVFKKNHRRTPRKVSKRPNSGARPAPMKRKDLGHPTALCLVPAQWASRARHGFSRKVTGVAAVSSGERV